VLAGELADELVDAAGARGVELPGGLVGEQDPRPVGERGTDRDPLLFASGELSWARAPLVRKPDALEQFIRAALPLVARRACQAELFRSDTKFDSHCGWPSFWSPLAGERVILREDSTMGMTRVEVLCAHCHSHLGHVFHGEGYGTPTDDRYCINSLSLKLDPADS